MSASVLREKLVRLKCLELNPASSLGRAGNANIIRNVCKTGVTCAEEKDSYMAPVGRTAETQRGEVLQGYVAGATLRTKQQKVAAPKQIPVELGAVLWAGERAGRRWSLRRRRLKAEGEKEGEENPPREMGRLRSVRRSCFGLRQRSKTTENWGNQVAAPPPGGEPGRRQWPAIVLSFSFSFSVFTRRRRRG